MTYSVKQLSDLAGVTIRTLHYYDEIGLLKPNSVSQVGYRFYSDADLEKLQQILFFKELQFSLQETKAIINSSDFNIRNSLITHKALMIEKKMRLEGIIECIEKAIQSIDGKVRQDKKEMFKAFNSTSSAGYR